MRARIIYLRELVFLSYSLSTKVLFDGDRVVCAALDSAVVGDDDTGDTLDNANTGDDTTSGDLGLGIELIASHWRQLHERCAGIYERSDSVPGQHLLSSEVFGACLFRAPQLDLGGEVLHLCHDFGHLLLVLLVLV